MLKLKGVQKRVSKLVSTVFEKIVSEVQKKLMFVISIWFKTWKIHFKKCVLAPYMLFFFGTTKTSANESSFELLRVRSEKQVSEVRKK